MGREVRKQLNSENVKDELLDDDRYHGLTGKNVLHGDENPNVILIGREL